MKAAHDKIFIASVPRNSHSAQRPAGSIVTKGRSAAFGLFFCLQKFCSQPSSVFLSCDLPVVYLKMVKDFVDFTRF
jgi:hypothetical protein